MLCKAVCLSEVLVLCPFRSVCYDLVPWRQLRNLTQIEEVKLLLALMPKKKQVQFASSSSDQPGSAHAALRR